MKKRKITARLMAFGKKNSVFKIISLVLLTVYLFGYYIKQYCIHNKKRYACIFCTCMVFAISSSFSFDGKDMQETVSEDGITAEYNKHEKMENGGNSMEEVEILEDKDVMEGYENSELEYVTEEDKFSIDEILTAGEAYLEGVSENSVKGQLSSDDWQLVLINKHHSIPDDYTFTLGTIRGGMQCDERIIPELMEMLQAAKEDGVSLIVCSPYRDMNRQQVLFERKIKAYMRQGYSYLEAYQISSQTVTVPGASEHQIGLAIDFLCKGYSSLNEGFADTEGGRWLAAHGHEYGFVLRYPKGKEYITGIEYEPWHYRYVGKEAAAIMTERGLTLEEFIEELSE
ncbi:MAG: M15 family metallopeptidase [Lachnospiraceae bacterium]|nr:M15 family metallopeptidase [Lachnospiraceae bacterium]